MEQSSVLVSVIIPVYNVLNYLEKCVRSVQEQTLHEIEIILVDDGSNDGSGKLCDKLSEKDQRIRVLHQNNQGLSAARNNGFASAHGTYIVFLDSDDYWREPRALAEMWELAKTGAKSLDLILFAYCKTNLKTNKTRSFALPALPAGSAFEQKLFLLRNRAYSNSACTKLFRRSFLLENNFFFPIGMKSEDLAWSRRVLTAARSLEVYPKTVMVYQTNRKDSICTSFSQRNFEDIVAQIQEEIGLLQVAGSEEQKLGYAYWAEQVVWFLGYWPSLNRPLRQVIKDHEFILELLPYGICKRCRLVYRLTCIFGAANTMRLLHFYLNSSSGFKK